MTYKVLTRMGKSYKDEEGNPTPRRDQALKDLERRLQKAIADAAEAKARAAEKHVAPTNLSVKQRKEFFEAERNRSTVLADANAEVVRVRKWLEKMGAWVKGDGTVELPRSGRRVLYDHQAEQQGLTKLSIAGGRLFSARDGKPLDTSNMVTAAAGPGFAIYVMSEHGNFYLSSHSVGERHHSSLLAGGPVAGAGEMKVIAGSLKWLSNKSGHYQPDIVVFLQVLHQLEKNSVPMNFVIRFSDPQNNWKDYANTGEFLTQMGLNDDQYDLNNLIFAYGDYLKEPYLKPTWEWRPSKGVYEKGTNTKIPARDVRTFLKASGCDPEQQQRLGDTR